MLLLAKALSAALALGAVSMAAMTVWIWRRYTATIVRIFEEKPLFLAPTFEPIADAEEVVFATRDGAELRGSYLPTRAGRRRGVVVFCHEYGADRWSCRPYCGRLRDEGFDIFTFDFRNQGESSHEEGYAPLQWVSHLEARDVRGALDYVRRRQDADPRGVGLFGVSKGGGAAILAAASHDYVRAVVSDGAFPTHATQIYYMQRWVTIYARYRWLYAHLPRWYFGVIGLPARCIAGWRRSCRFASLERAVGRISPKPLLMIHGARDNYILPEIAGELFRHAREPRELWIVPGANHNGAVEVASDAYFEKVRGFFTKHLDRRPALAAAS